MLQGERNREKLYAENFTCQHITTTVVYSICKVESRLLNFLHVHSSKTGPSKYILKIMHIDQHWKLENMQCCGIPTL